VSEAIFCFGTRPSGVHVAQSGGKAKARAVLIKLEVLEAIKRGDITLQFRRWTRPSVKAGGTLKTKLGQLHIGRIDDMDPADVTATDARKAGFKDVADFHRWLATMKQGPLFHRIEVSFDEP
jgi:hypothetical protein